MVPSAPACCLKEKSLLFCLSLVLSFSCPLCCSCLHFSINHLFKLPVLPMYGVLFLFYLFLSFSFCLLIYLQFLFFSLTLILYAYIPKPPLLWYLPPVLHHSLAPSALSSLCSPELSICIRAGLRSMDGQSEGGAICEQLGTGDSPGFVWRLS